MADGVVQVPVDSTGKRIDTTELTRADAVVVERQRLVIADNEFFGNVARVMGDGSQLVKQLSADELLLQILQELRVHSVLLHEGLALTRQFELDALRNPSGISVDPAATPLT